MDCISKDSGTAVSMVPTLSSWTDSDMVHLKIDKLSGNISFDTTEKMIIGDGDLTATKIIKLVCEDIERDFKDDEDATPEVNLFVSFTFIVYLKETLLVIS